ncbi:MAG: hypothetical protein ACOYKE_01230 [Ferruginibacter sp.]
MERVATLIQKLQQQLKEGATASKMLVTARLLESELISLPAAASEMVSIDLPVIPIVKQETSATVTEIPFPAIEIVSEPHPEEKIIEVLQVDEAEIEAELDEIKRNMQAMQQMTSVGKPRFFFDQEDPEQQDIPTLNHQPAQVFQTPAPAPTKEVHQLIANEEASLNDSLNNGTAALAEKLTETPVKDLKKAIGINDRYLYINELFRGDEAMYERSIKTINSFSIWPEAEYWIRRELKTKLGWLETDAMVKQFDQLVKRRFS